MNNIPRESGSSTHYEKEEVRLLHEILHELKLILRELKKSDINPVASFKILVSLIGDQMNINAGQSTVLTAVPLDSTGNPTVLPSGDVPNWSASDTSNITATPDPTGLMLIVAVNANAPAGDVVFTIADSAIPSATGTFTLSITPGGGPGPGTNPVASFSITASAPGNRGGQPYTQPGRPLVR